MGNKINDAEKFEKDTKINKPDSLNPTDSPFLRKSYRQSKKHAKCKHISKENIPHATKFFKDKFHFVKPIDQPWKQPPHDYTFNFNGYMFGQIASHDIADRILSRHPGKYSRKFIN